MKFRRGDILVYLAVTLLALGIWLVPVLTAKEGSFVDISQDGQLIERASLSDTRRIELSGCTVEIRDGSVCVVESTCPDLVCVKSGRISKSGESIICVPNRVKLEISGAGAVDVISG